MALHRESIAAYLLLAGLVLLVAGVAMLRVRLDGPDHGMFV